MWYVNVTDRNLQNLYPHHVGPQDKWISLQNRHARKQTAELCSIWLWTDKTRINVYWTRGRDEHQKVCWSHLIHTSPLKWWSLFLISGCPKSTDAQSFVSRGVWWTFQALFDRKKDKIALVSQPKQITARDQRFIRRWNNYVAACLQPVIDGIRYLYLCISMYCYFIRPPHLK